jgi:predicted permease
VLESVWSDVRYAVRALGRNPGFAIATVLTIALAIGINTGVFSLLNSLLLRDLSAPDAHQLVAIEQTVEGGQIESRAGFGTFSTEEYLAYRDRTQTLSGVLAYANSPRTILGRDVQQVILGQLVSCNFFTVLRQPPVLGREPSAQDCLAGADPVVVLSHDLWVGSFAANPDIVGRTVELNRQLFTVIGVAAEGTSGAMPVRIDYFAPLSAEPLLRSGQRPRFANDRYLWLSLLGRRNSGTSLDAVRAELEVIAAQIDASDPGRSTTLVVERARPNLLPSAARPMAYGAAAVLMVAFGAILLIACANVANLLLARGATRSQEIAMRLALGASRTRIVRQLLTESLLIALAGGLAGCVIAVWMLQALIAFALPALIPPEVPIGLALDLRPDFRVMGFAVAVTIGAGVLFGLSPALQASRPDLHGAIKQDSAGAGGGRHGGRMRGTLVGVQIALCMMLMIGAGLLLRGLYSTYTVEPGFAYRDVTAVSFELWLDVYDAAERTMLLERLGEGVAALPDVEALALAMRAPLGSDISRIAIHLPGESPAQARQAELNAVGPAYFSVLELPIVQGRAFTEADLASNTAEFRSAIVSAATVRNLWPDGDALGRTLLWGDVTLQIVGVAADAQVSTLGVIDPHYVYVPGRGGAAMLVKSRTDFATTAAGIRAVARAIDPTLIVPMQPLEASLGWWRGVSGTVTTLAAVLGVLALVLASVGIYGVVAYSVRLRYREIGIRIALGANLHSVLATILRRTLRPVVIGAVIGISAALALSSVLSAVLFGVSARDPVGLGSAVLFVIGVALGASLLAARPAMRADPNIVLRYE